MEITGYPWAGDVYHVYATRGGVNPITGEPARDEPLFGHGPDFGYSYFGVIWYGDEIWNGGRFTDYDKDGRIDEWEVLRWHDENRPGKGDFQDWTPFKHPQLGDVEIGGLNPKFWSQNPPPDLIETWAKNEAMFNLYLAQQLAQVKVIASCRPPAKGAAGVFDVKVDGDQRRPDADRARDGQAREDRAAGHLCDPAGRGAGAGEGSRRARPSRRRRDRLAEAGRDKDGHVAGEGRRHGYGIRPLHAWRRGPEGDGHPVMPYAFFPHTGDIGVRVWGDSCATLIASAAQAFTEVLTDPSVVRGADAVALTMRAAAPDLLLRDFLDELLFQFDARHRLVRDADAVVTRDGDDWVLKAITHGEAWDPARHAIKVLVKGITYHQLSVVETADGWSATVVLDI